MSNRERKSYLPEIRRLEVEPVRPKLRLALVVLLLAVGAASIVWALRASTSARSGWVEITANASQTENCSDEFIFRYRLGKNSAEEYRLATEVYTEASARAFQLFHPTRRFDGVGNLALLNAAPNETVTLDEPLYQALALLEQSGDRGIYLAPVYAQYDAVFRSVSDETAAAYDPAFDKEAETYVERFLALAADPDAVRIELEGDDRARLCVSEAYLSLAREYGVSCFVDFYWMRNAFAADLIAQALLDAGLRHGYLVSTDGFGRCLDREGERYALRVTEMDGETLTQAAEYSYTGPMALVDLRAFPQTEGTEDCFYRYADGALRTPYLRADGTDRCAVSELYLCAREQSCAGLLLKAKPLFMADSFDEAAAAALSNEGIAALCFRGGRLFENAAVDGLLKKE